MWEGETRFRRLSQLRSFRVGVAFLTSGLLLSALVAGARLIGFESAWTQMESYPQGNHAPRADHLPRTFVEELGAIWGHDALFVVASTLGPLCLLSGLLVLSRPWGALARRESPRVRAFAPGLCLVGGGCLCLLYSLLAILEAAMLS